MSIGITKTFNLDMVPGGAPPIIHVSAEDVGRPYEANLLYNGEVYEVQGNRLTIAGTKPDGTVFEYPVDDFEQDESYADFTIKAQMAIVPGMVKCKLREYLNDDKIGSATFILDVDENVYNPDASSESDIATISDYVAETVNEYIEEHPESIIAVPDGGITTAKLADGSVTDVKISDTSTLVSSSFYDEITFSKSRTNDTDYYVAYIPRLDNDGNIIELYVAKDSSTTPLSYAQKNGTTVTSNNCITMNTSGGSSKTGNIIGSGQVINSQNISANDNLIPNGTGYLCISQDRQIVKSYAITTPLTTLQADTDVYQCMTYYWKLVENGSAVDNSATTANEPNVVTDRHPRLAFGVLSDKTFVILACDGRTSINKGMTSDELAALMISLGCTDAWNMDGGGSTSLIACGSKMNRNIDGNGTNDRLISYKLSARKTPQSTNFVDVYGKIGFEKQNVIQQIIPALHAASVDNLTGVGTVLPEGSNLNNYLTAGKYVSPTASNTDTLSNCPVSDQGFDMYVLAQGISGYYLQVLFGNDGHSCYSRIISSSVPTNWRSLSPMRVQGNTGTLSASSWGDHYYQDIDISEYIPSGMYVYAITPGPMTSGGVLQMVLQEEKTLRILNDKDFTGSIAYFNLLLK